MIGTVVGNFRIVEKLGEGGMGTVYRGIDQMVERNVAIKIWKQAAEILLWTLDGVRHAHQAGILHRDLKPAHIMITPDGRVKVTDFGIARVLNTLRLTREALVVGTLEYLAPERALGRAADARSDLYSLSVVFTKC
jgi:eukaryotic-like serine/threonine-protein kinase